MLTFDRLSADSSYIELDYLRREATSGPAAVNVIVAISAPDP
jgi:hypothetical protein